MEKRYFWRVVKTYNMLMKASIEGPNCTDPDICDGGCCSIHIDVAKLLAEKYIERGFATKSDFIRSDIFAFKLALNPKTNKCVLFDEDANGCIVHETGIKPVQCWIYPTRFSNPDGEDINCKCANGWKIIDKEKIQKAEELLDRYKFLCKLEAKKELRLVQERIRYGEQNNLASEIRKFKPSELGGFQDAWNTVKPLSAEGYSLQLKKFCKKHNPECKHLPNAFMNCDQICERIANELISFLKQNLYEFISENGADTDGEYPFFKLFEFAGLKSFNGS